MASGIVIVPSKNPVLQRIAQQLAAFDEVRVLDSGNAVLWQARQNPPAVVLADVELEDMSGADFVEILPNLSPGTRLILSGAPSPALDRAMQGTTVQLITPGESFDHNVWMVYQALGIAPPAPRVATGQLSADPSVSTPVTNNSSQSAQRAGKVAAVEPVKPVQPNTKPASTPPSVPASRPIPPSISNTPTRLGSIAKPVTGTAKPRIAPPTALPTVPAPTLPPSQPRDPFATRSGPLIVRPQQEMNIRTLLKMLVDDVGAQSVMLSDMAGMVLMEVGDRPNVMTYAVGPLLAMSFSTAAELSRQLGEQEANALYFHEGTNYDIYAFNVGYRFILTLILAKHSGASKLGSVWVYAKRVTRQIQLALGS